MSTVRTPIGLMCFPHLFTPRPAFQGGDPRYSCALLFTAAQQKSPEWLAVRAAVAAAVDETWGAGKSKDKAFWDKLRKPWRKCEERGARDGFKDMPGGLFIQPWSKNKPQVVDALVQPVVVANDVWSGQTARATVTAFTYDNAGNRGVNLGLANLQICDVSGPRLDGRKPAAEEFDRVANDNEESALVDADEPPF